MTSSRVNLQPASLQPSPTFSPGASSLPFLDVRAGKRDSHEMRDGGEFEVRRIRSLEPRASNFLSRLTRLSLGPSPEDETLYKPIIFPHIDPAVHS
jgi:hypothetical protein